MKRAMILLIKMLFYIAESLLGNSDIDVARYWKENSTSRSFAFIGNNLHVPQYWRNIQTSLEAWLSYLNFSSAKIIFDKWRSK